MTRANWVSVREFNGQDLVYVTQIWSWRCGLVEMKIGLNGEAPQVLPLPPCHEDQPTPNAILEGDGLPYVEAPARSVAQIEVHLTYDDLSTDSLRVDRAGRILP